MAYEIHKRGAHLNARDLQDPGVYLGSTSMSFNAAACEIIGDRNRACLAVDKDQMMAALVASEDGDADSYPLVFSKRRTQCHLSCLAFLKSYKLQKAGTRQCFKGIHPVLLEWSMSPADSAGGKQ